MPNENLSENAKKAMTAPETAEVLLHVLTIYYDEKVLTRVVDNTEEIRSGNDIFVPCSFSVLLPNQSSDGGKSCRLQIDNTDISVYKTIKSAVIRSLREKKKITCDVGVIMASEPDTYIQGPLSFVLRNINATVQNVTGELYDLYMQDRKFCTLTYNPDDFPGMFW